MEKKDVVRGQINTVILSSLFDGEKYGYEIRKEIELKTSGKFILKEPTLYSSLKRLEKSGFVESSWGDLEDTNGGRRRYYRLTDKGREVCERNLNEWEYSRTLMDKLISDREIDLATAEPPVYPDSDVTSKVKRNYIRDIDANSRKETDEAEADADEDRLDPPSPTDADPYRDVHEILERNERELAEVGTYIETMRESFETRIREIENRSGEEPEESENLDGETPEENEPSEDHDESEGEYGAEEKGYFDSLSEDDDELSTKENEEKAEEESAESSAETQSIKDALSLFDDADPDASPAREADSTEEKVAETQQASDRTEPFFIEIPDQEPAAEQQPEPESLHSVRDYTSFQVEDRIQREPEYSDELSRYIQETKEKRADEEDRTYKSKLGKLLSAAKSSTSAPDTPRTASVDDEDQKIISFEAAAARSESRRKDPVENEDLKALSSKIQAEGFKIKAYDAEKNKEYKSFVLKNKLNFFASLFLFGAFAIGLLLFFLITEPVTRRGYGVYGILTGCAALLPLVAFIAYKLNPDRKTKAKFSFRESFLNCVLIFAYAFLVIMSLNLIFKVQFANVAEIVLKVFLPSFVAFQLVVACAIYAILYRNPRFYS